jgi:hypothetical protein
VKVRPVQAVSFVFGLPRLMFHSTQIASIMLWWVQKTGSSGDM